TDVGAGDDRPIDVDGIAGIGHQHGVAAVERGQHQVGQAFFRADGDNGFAVGIELDRVAALVPIANGLAQARNTLRYRIPVGGGPAGGLDQLVDDVLGRGAVGVAHRHVDDVLPAPPGGHLELAGNVEHVRGQTLDA